MITFLEFTIDSLYVYSKLFQQGYHHLGGNVFVQVSMSDNGMFVCGHETLPTETGRFKLYHLTLMNVPTTTIHAYGIIVDAKDRDEFEFCRPDYVLFKYDDQTFRAFPKEILEKILNLFFVIVPFKTP